jgi:hypothetical protein
MMGRVVPDTCWASNKICNKNYLLHSGGILFPYVNDDARSKSLQKKKEKPLETYQTVTNFEKMSEAINRGVKQNNKIE